MSSKKNMQLHIVMYPWLALGHLTSFLQLANKLAEKGHRISFFLPTKTQSKLASLNHHPELIRFIPILVPHVDGLPPGAETTNEVPPKDHPLLVIAMDMTQDVVESYISHHKTDFIFFDFPLWIPRLAQKHGSKAVYYITLNLMIFAYAGLQARNLPSYHHLAEADLVEPPPCFPNQEIRLQTHEARAMANILGTNFGGGLTFLERHNLAIQESDAIGAKTCREIEGSYCHFVEKHFGKPVLLAGPVVPQNPASELDDTFNTWLSGFSHGSVVYCALGSECVLGKHHFQELVLGLELTGRPFLAALRPPTGYCTIESALPEGFEERIKGKGIVHGGWVQQQLILQHPSVGCFVTHCGAGSMSEAMVSECQIAMMPQAVDQFLNARLMSIELRVGVEVEKREDDGYFTREAVNKAVSLVMEAESEVGREVRSNHAKWRSFLLKEGLEESYISRFIQCLQQMLG